MKTGDIVQIRQHDAIPSDPMFFRANPPIQGGLIESWIFARAIDVPAQGPVRVQVCHPGNREHGQVQLVDPKNIRDKAAVLALRDAVNLVNPRYAAQMKKHYEIQAGLLS